ncbi:hypothetical protein FACS1894163_06600 [Spirochaetia bacterium]|nr:hypothetical protein FACS1894163_06600 [Spirochaetia bacterium]
MDDDVIYGDFIWNRKKAEENKAKHRISFEEASTIYSDPFRSLEYDEKNSTPDEERYNIIGVIEKILVVFVTTMERNDKIRIISARRATTKEQERYNENIKQFLGL